MEPESISEVGVVQFRGGAFREVNDSVAVEEPLEIRLDYTVQGKREQRSLSITMRTPGEDFDLVRGFLYTEGIIQHASQIKALHLCGRPAPGTTLRNTVRVTLAPEVELDFKRLERHFYTTSSCGVCGKTSLEALRQTSYPPIAGVTLKISPQWIASLPVRLREAQSVFDRTGGLHASALFDTTGELICLREDVGRHNALDKLIGVCFEQGRLPLSEHVLLLSGRVSFELMQKALMAGIPIVVAVGAPSSLAVEMAREFGITLLGFTREDRFNIYSGSERIDSSSTL